MTSFFKTLCHSKQYKRSEKWHCSEPPTTNQKGQQFIRLSYAYSKNDYGIFRKYCSPWRFMNFWSAIFFNLSSFLIYFHCTSMHIILKGNVIFSSDFYPIIPRFLYKFFEHLFSGNFKPLFFSLSKLLTNALEMSQVETWKILNSLQLNVIFDPCF